MWDDALWKLKLAAEMKPMQELPYKLNRTVLIDATPETVFRFFTDSARWAVWWGTGSAIDARPGGEVYIRYPSGVEVVGEVLEVRPPEQISFTYGYASGNPIPPGSRFRMAASHRYASGPRPERAVRRSERRAARLTAQCEALKRRATRRWNTWGGAGERISWS